MSDVKPEKIENVKEEYEHSKLIMASYGSRELLGQWIGAAFGFSVFFFYEVIIGLDSFLAFLAYLIYSIWNAVNDPLVGWLTEKLHMPWEKKWGVKRNPWMLIFVVPWLLSFIFVFMVPQQWDPQVDPSYNLPVFGWFVMSVCLYDTFLTLYDVNVLSLYPEKFRGLGERKTVQGFGTILGILGLVLAAIVPPFIQDKTVPSTYVTAALMSVIVGFFLFLLMLPGAWEDKVTKERYRQRRERPETATVEPFVKSIGIMVRDRRFMLKAFYFFGYQVAGLMIQASGYYVTTFILDTEEGAFTILLGAMLLGALISVPLWLHFSHKVNDNKKMSLYAGFAMFVTFLPMIFVGDIIGWAISLLLFGIGVGGQWFMDPPTMGDVLDDVAVRTGKRQQSIYYGFQTFVIRMGNSFIGLTIALTHILTGFVEGATSLAELQAANPTGWQLAVFGVHIHSALVPAILVIITVILFWKFYDITPKVVKENKKKLKELGL